MEEVVNLYNLAQINILQRMLDQGYAKLPVAIKDLHAGPGGGVFYINSRGNRVYLKTGQLRQLREMELVGCSGPLCRASGGKNAHTDVAASKALKRDSAARQRFIS